ncbi:hypothetical protein H6P81_020540 [Aristolochia fimbriata]|uniref:Uncharacterized protein n=1 Tax=Aristolochia fimbriata TaxID=158543 RepID=A0AAV7DUN8_ARIFI|nr:hypothetical protein H6P81_020540 [Aristolochia fimbriata]
MATYARSESSTTEGTGDRGRGTPGPPAVTVRCEFEWGSAPRASECIYVTAIVILVENRRIIKRNGRYLGMTAVPYLRKFDLPTSLFKTERGSTRDGVAAEAEAAAPCAVRLLPRSGPHQPLSAARETDRFQGRARHLLHQRSHRGEDAESRRRRHRRQRPDPGRNRAPPVRVLLRRLGPRQHRPGRLHGQPQNRGSAGGQGPHRKAGGGRSARVVRRQQSLRAVGSGRGGGAGHPQRDPLGPVLRRFLNVLPLLPLPGDVPEFRRVVGGLLAEVTQHAGTPVPGPPEFHAPVEPVQEPDPGHLRPDRERLEGLVGARRVVRGAGEADPGIADVVGGVVPRQAPPRGSPVQARPQRVDPRLRRHVESRRGVRRVAGLAAAGVGGLRLVRERGDPVAGADGGGGPRDTRLREAVLVGGEGRRAEGPAGGVRGGDGPEGYGGAVESSGKGALAPLRGLLRDPLRLELDHGEPELRRARRRFPAVGGPDHRRQVPRGRVRRRGPARGRGGRSGRVQGGSDPGDRRAAGRAQVGRDQGRVHEVEGEGGGRRVRRRLLRDQRPGVRGGYQARETKRRGRSRIAPRRWRLRVETRERDDEGGPHLRLDRETRDHARDFLSGFSLEE